MSVQALPQWARDTLTQHAGDPRELKTMRQLEEGSTGDKMWDALQQQLVATGMQCPHVCISQAQV